MFSLEMQNQRLLKTLYNRLIRVTTRFRTSKRSVSSVGLPGKFRESPRREKTSALVRLLPLSYAKTIALDHHAQCPAAVLLARGPYDTLKNLENRFKKCRPQRPAPRQTMTNNHVFRSIMYTLLTSMATAPRIVTGPDLSNPKMPLKDKEERITAGQKFCPENVPERR